MPKNWTLLTPRAADMFDPEFYGISVKKVVLDGETLYAASVRELPDVLVYEDSSDAAYSTALDVVEGLHKASVEHQKAFPAPLEEEDTEYSGRVTLRMSLSLHKDADEIAHLEAQSLNSYLTEQIARAVGEYKARRSVQASSNADSNIPLDVFRWAGAQGNEVENVATASRIIEVAKDSETAISVARSKTTSTSSFSPFEANGFH